MSVSDGHKQVFATKERKVRKKGEQLFFSFFFVLEWRLTDEAKESDDQLGDAFDGELHRGDPRRRRGGRGGVCFRGGGGGGVRAAVADAEVVAVAVAVLLRRGGRVDEDAEDAGRLRRHLALFFCFFSFHSGTEDGEKSVVAPLLVVEAFLEATLPLIWAN